MLRAFLQSARLHIECSSPEVSSACCDNDATYSSVCDCYSMPRSGQCRKPAQKSESAVVRQEYNENVGPKDMLLQASKAIVETKFCKL